MQSRADAVEETRLQILHASYELWLGHTYEELSLERIADRAGVSKQTVIRQFGSKEQLFFETVDYVRPREEAARVVEPGDVRAAVAIVVERYEELGDANVRVLELENRVPAVRHLLEQGRESHRLWIERVFAPFLPKRKGPAYARRVMAFYSATEVMVWKLLRRDFKLSREQTEAVLFEMVSALVAHDDRKGER
jgi:AcrR family transcriptional regulator